MKILYIVGHPRGGSTLLQHVLALQKRVVAVGEIRGIQRLFTEKRQCACGAPLRECEFWKAVGTRMGLAPPEIVTNPSRDPERSRFRHAVVWLAAHTRSYRLAAPLFKDDILAARMCLRVHRVVADLQGSEVVVDSSKSPSGFLHLYHAAPSDVVPIFLVRDGRGVVWSKMKRTGIDAREATARWLRTTRLLLAVRKVVPPALRTIVRYEDLCADPRAVLQGILDRFGLSVHTVDISELSTQRHDLGGSPRFRAQIPGKIEVDESWRDDMPKEALLAFNVRCQAVNYRFGYK